MRLALSLICVVAAIVQTGADFGPAIDVKAVRTVIEQGRLPPGVEQATIEVTDVAVVGNFALGTYRAGATTSQQGLCRWHGAWNRIFAGVAGTADLIQAGYPPEVAKEIVAHVEYSRGVDQLGRDPKASAEDRKTFGPEAIATAARQFKPISHCDYESSGSAPVGAVSGSAGQTPPAPASPQAATPPAPPRPTPPTRDPKTPGYVEARELPDGTLPPPDAEGNFIVGPTHTPAPEAIEQEGVPRGTICTFEMSSAESQIYPGIARTANTFGTPDPNDPTALIVTTSHPQPWTRKIAVYVPKGYTPGTIAPFIVGADGPDQILFTVLDNLIAQKRVPALVGISIANGGGDAQGSQRGLEYDTMSGRYAEFVQREVLPMVEQRCQVTLTQNPDGRATMGGSSGGSAALIMAWYHPEWYRRVLTYSGTYVNQQWPHNAETPHGAWEFHEHLIPQSPPKPIRLWLHVGDRDLLNPNVMRDEMHDWVLANERMAHVLKAQGYHYQFVFVRNAGHTERIVKQQTLPEALEWLWQGYPR